MKGLLAKGWPTIWCDKALSTGSGFVRWHVQFTDGSDCLQAWQLMFDSVDTANDCIRIATGVLSTIKINPKKMLAGLSPDMLATDLAEYLVRKGMPQSRLILNMQHTTCPSSLRIIVVQKVPTMSEDTTATCYYPGDWAIGCSVREEQDAVCKPHLS